MANSGTFSALYSRITHSRLGDLLLVVDNLFLDKPMIPLPEFKEFLVLNVLIGENLE